jgi:uncharacterized protein (DUF697 family)
MYLGTFNEHNSHIFESVLRTSLNKLEEFKCTKSPKDIRQVILVNNLSNFICKLLDELIMAETPHYIPKKLTAPPIDSFEAQTKLKININHKVIVNQQQVKFNNLDEVLVTKQPKRSKKAKIWTKLFKRKKITTFVDTDSQSTLRSSITLTNSMSWSLFDKKKPNVDLVSNTSCDLNQEGIKLGIQPVSPEIGSIEAWIESTKAETIEWNSWKLSITNTLYRISTSAYGFIISMRSDVTPLTSSFASTIYGFISYAYTNGVVPLTSSVAITIYGFVSYAYTNGVISLVASTIYWFLSYAYTNGVIPLTSLVASIIYGFVSYAYTLSRSQKERQYLKDGLQSTIQKSVPWLIPLKSEITRIFFGRITFMCSKASSLRSAKGRQRLKESIHSTFWNGVPVGLIVIGLGMAFRNFASKAL